MCLNLHPYTEVSHALTRMRVPHEVEQLIAVRAVQVDRSG